MTTSDPDSARADDGGPDPADGRLDRQNRRDALHSADSPDDLDGLDDLGSADSPDSHADEGFSDSAASPDSAVEPSRARRSPLVIAAVVLLVVCLGAAGWFGVAWLRASTDGDLDVARARDDAVRAGEQAVITFHTMDYRAVDANLDRWVAASTGDMLAQLERGRASGKTVIEQSKRISSATVYSTAIIDLNDTTGTATIISAVHQKVTEAGSDKPVDKYLRVQAALQRVSVDGGEGWRLSGLTYIAPTPAG